MSIKAPKEADIQATIKQWLRLNGAVVIRQNSGGARAVGRGGKTRYVKFNDTDGCSDIVACVGGVFVAIEVKRPGARTDPLRLAKQQAFLASIQKAHGIAMFATSVEDVAAELRRHGMQVAT